MHRAWAEVDAAALAGNIRLLQQRYGHEGQTRIMAVVKANAYGHESSIIAPECAKAGLTDFGVATAAEGIALRSLLPPHVSIYLLCPALLEEAEEIVAHRLIPLISSMEMGQRLAAAAHAQSLIAEAHLDVDTGIGRSGVAVSNAPSVLRALDHLPSLKITGIATHFACADESPDDAHAQQEIFAALLSSLKTRTDTLLLHAANSPATLILPPSRCQMIRPGLLLYGIEPAPGMLAEAGLGIEPVLSLKARVLLCRDLPAGATISYGKTYTVPRGGGRYATLGIGYGDGFPRRLSSSGTVLLHGRYAPIRGRICMDQMVIDVTDNPKVQAGDIATLIGRDGDEQIRASDLAAAIGTTPHEITTCLTARIPRLFTN